MTKSLTEIVLEHQNELLFEHYEKLGYYGGFNYVRHNKRSQTDAEKENQQHNGGGKENEIAIDDTESH